MPRTNLRVDAREFSQLLNQAAEFDKKLTSKLRTNLRKAAEPAVADVKSVLAEPPPSGGGGGRRIHRYVTKTSRKKSGVDENGKATYTKTVSRIRESFGVREALARGTALSISKAKSGGSVSIKTSAKFLPARHKPMAKLYNKKSWRHPVIGEPDRWVEQSGRPYFGTAILAHREELKAAVERALDEAVDIVAPHTGRSRRLR